MPFIARADSQWAKTSRLVRSTACRAFARRWESSTGLCRYPRSLRRFSKLRATVKRTWFSASFAISRLVQDLAHPAQQAADRKRLGQVLLTITGQFTAPELLRTSTHQQNPRAGIKTGEFNRQFAAVHPGHDHIGKHKIERPK